MWGRGTAAVVLAVKECTYVFVPFWLRVCVCCLKQEPCLVVLKNLARILQFLGWWSCNVGCCCYCQAQWHSQGQQESPVCFSLALL
jgi:hypothetical protein